MSNTELTNETTLPFQVVVNMLGISYQRLYRFCNDRKILIKDNTQLFIRRECLDRLKLIDNRLYYLPQ